MWSLLTRLDLSLMWTAPLAKFPMPVHRLSNAEGVEKGASSAWPEVGVRCLFQDEPGHRQVRVSGEQGTNHVALPSRAKPVQEHHAMHWSLFCSAIVSLVAQKSVQVHPTVSKLQQPETWTDHGWHLPKGMLTAYIYISDVGACVWI